jgi:8-oxo-dGTP pyrophosphatase MutT (NUDIX family)
VQFLPNFFGIKMTPQHLRQLFSKAIPRDQADVSSIPAAVLIPLFYENSELMMLFTQRTYLVKHHRGQISFPGGVQDPDDDNLLATALRESQEEIGLAPQEVDVLGFLNATLTITGFQVYSFVGLVPYPYEFLLNDREVARLLAFPVRQLLQPHRWRTGPHDWEGKHSTVYYCQMPQTTIWGATARILVDFLALLNPAFEPAAIPESTFEIN